MEPEHLYRLWLKKTTENTELQDELNSIEGRSAEIEDRFYRELEFGTGGLRGVLGAGTNRMNIFTVARATRGLAVWLKEHYEAPSVAIGYDSRLHSEDFAETAANVLAENGIDVWVYPRLMPTPALSFAVRELKCSAGVVITASHNPSRYNGYKVYGSDGCQITTAVASEIFHEISALDYFDIPASHEKKGKIRRIGDDVAEAYQEAVSNASLLPKIIDRSLSVVYTPLNGTGISCVPEQLRRQGFTNFFIVPEQEKPDGHFPTCPYPNPELPEALQLGLAYANERSADLLLATDPDCDRVGAAVRGSDGRFIRLTGNEVGVLLLDYVCALRAESGSMPKHPVAVKTIVTTPMAEGICSHYGVELRNVLTGFKYIGEQIGRLEKAGEADRYIFGFEESCGYLSGTFVRDKDGVNACLLLCEAAAWHKSRGATLLDALDDLYRDYGFYRTRLLSYTFEGSAGFTHMKDLMGSLRKEPPDILGERTVASCDDFFRENTGLPRADVLRFRMDRCEAVVRPSGTEPKLKVYLTASLSSAEESNAALDALNSEFDRRLR